MEFRVLQADRNFRWVRSRAAPRRDEQGRIIRWYGTLDDVHERRQAEAALRESEANYRCTVELSPQIPWIADPAGQVVTISPRWSEIIGMTQAETMGMGWRVAIHPEDAARMEASWFRAMNSGTPLDVESRIRLRDGSYRWFRARAAPQRDEQGRILRWYGTDEDIHEHKLAEQQVSYMAYHDPLTDLPNRRLFHRQLEQALAAPGSGRQVALHFIDLDQFKGVNDTLGHMAGDALLRQAAGRLRDCIPAGSLLARLGGDEFAIIQAGPEGGPCGAEDAACLARRVVEVLGEDYQIDQQQAVVGASIGIALISHPGTTPEEAIRNADIALYRAKADGRATFRFFEPALDEQIRRDQALRSGLRTALEREELDLHFQPLVGISQPGVTCLEALLRWRHPLRGMVPPSEFIPAAEESGLITRIGAWALRTACHEAARWPWPIPVAVNLSPVQFRHPGLVQMVADALAEAGLAAGRLELEITESALLQDDQASLSILRELGGLGVRLALDDFGTGFSSLGYLLRFPFHKIKIDRSFVAGLPEGRESKAVIRAVVSMGRSLGIAVTAEGVETAEQLAVLRRLGCDDAQGYLFSRPLPAASLAPLIGRLHRPNGAGAA
jgi:diguanylate cyclase (GGDEF)-like protein/PAS domain S-box-containing protein